MHFTIDLRRTLTTRISRLIPAQKTPQRPAEQNSIEHRELYESIAMGNALADIEDEANRAWRGR